MSNGPIKVPPPTTPRPHADPPPPMRAAHGEHTHPCPWCAAAGAQQERERLRTILRGWEDAERGDEEQWTVYDTDRGHMVIGLDDVERLLADPKEETDDHRRLRFIPPRPL